VFVSRNVLSDVESPSPGGAVSPPNLNVILGQIVLPASSTLLPQGVVAHRQPGPFARMSMSPPSVWSANTITITCTLASPAGIGREAE